jgi:hypothetical protein
LCGHSALIQHLVSGLSGLVRWGEPLQVKP